MSKRIEIPNHPFHRLTEANANFPHYKAAQERLRQYLDQVLNNHEKPVLNDSDILTMNMVQWRDYHWDDTDKEDKLLGSSSLILISNHNVESKNLHLVFNSLYLYTRDFMPATLVLPKYFSEINFMFKFFVENDQYNIVRLIDINGKNLGSLIHITKPARNIKPDVYTDLFTNFLLADTRDPLNPTIFGCETPFDVRYAFNPPWTKQQFDERELSKAYTHDPRRYSEDDFPRRGPGAE